ncbi:MAG: hypothetical protein V1926_03525 [Candidatus Peregrinibacteria bacterium]
MAKARKKTVKKTKARKAKNVVKKLLKKKTVRKVVKTKKAVVLGKVTHFYDRISVAVVALNAVLKVGDPIRLQHGDKEFSQRVSSMQVNHLPITVAKKGDEIGLKVKKAASEGTLVLAG